MVAGLLIGVATEAPWFVEDIDIVWVECAGTAGRIGHAGEDVGGRPAAAAGR